MEEQTGTASSHGDEQTPLNTEGGPLLEDMPLVENTKFYTIEGEDEQGNPENSLSGVFIPPYQPSGEILLTNGVLSQSGSFQSAAIAPPVPRRKKSRLGLIGLIAAAALVVLLAGLMLVSAFAKPQMTIQQRNGVPTSMGTQQAMGIHPMMTHTPPPARVTPTAMLPSPTVGTTLQPQASGVPPDQLLQQLGWTTAGLSVADAIQADRTAVTFTDREEGLVFNEPATRTAAEFLLTPAGRNRFAQNDVRVNSGTLWNSVTDPARQLIQLAVNEQPTLVKQVAQGQNQFAWVDVQFELWQSHIDPQNPNQRIGGLEVDPATATPRMHHMVVLLLQVAPGSLGGNAPMGGTGWLVSNYMLDPAAGTLPNIVAPV